MSKINELKISNNLKSLDKNQEQENKYSAEIEFNRSKINKSWDFTPFPKFLFPNEKKQFLNDFNKLNFKGVNSKYNKDDKKQKYKLFVEEIKGDITKTRAPAYTFGSPRNEVKLPFYDFHELISPSPGSYNLRPLEGFISSSPKYSFPKKYTNKYKYAITEVSPGPGHYQLNKCDLSNQGNYQLSTYTNSPNSNFGLYKEPREKNLAFKSRNNVNIGPGSYDTNGQLTMFSGNGKYVLSNFSSNNSKTISNNKCLYRCHRVGVSPGPGTYNHHSIFIGGRYSK